MGRKRTSRSAASTSARAARTSRADKTFCAAQALRAERAVARRAMQK